MTFTRRTYRVAIARSIRMEGRLHARFERAMPGRESINAWHTWCTQTARTARLQRRKRRERK